MIWSFYDATTGRFSGRTFSGSLKLLEQNTLPGYAAIEGRFDPLSQRVDLGTGEVVAYQRPQSEIDAEQRALRDTSARRAIEALERGPQPRAVREALLAILPEGPGRDRLKEIDDEIAVRRGDLSP